MRLALVLQEREGQGAEHRFGMTPAEYAEDLGWVGPDVWLAHCVHLDGTGLTPPDGRTGMVEIREGEGRSLKWARLEPFDGYKLSFEIDFDHRVVNSTGQRVEFAPHALAQRTERSTSPQMVSRSPIRRNAQSAIRGRTGRVVCQQK